MPGREYCWYGCKGSGYVIQLGGDGNLLNQTTQSDQSLKRYVGVLATCCQKKSELGT